MNNAVTTAEPKPHASVGLDIYARITSPLRRYADLITAYQIKSFLRTGDTQKLPFQFSELKPLLDGVHYTSKKIDWLQKRAQRFWKYQYVARNYRSNSEFDAIVFEISQSSPNVLPENKVYHICYWIEKLDLNGTIVVQGSNSLKLDIGDRFILLAEITTGAVRWIPKDERLQYYKNIS